MIAEGLGKMHREAFEQEEKALRVGQRHSFTSASLLGRVPVPLHYYFLLCKVVTTVLPCARARDSSHLFFVLFLTGGTMHVLSLPLGVKPSCLTPFYRHRLHKHQLPWKPLSQKHLS